MEIKGGDRLAKKLNAMANKIAGGGSVRVGFLENATYPAKVTKKKNAPPLKVATVAFWNEYGTSRSKARPFFRNMIADQSPTWGHRLSQVAKATNYNGPRTLGLIGQHIKDQLVKSIVDWPADNAPRTVAIKGFNKGLIDTAVMQRSVDFEVIRK